MTNVPLSTNRSCLGRLLPDDARLYLGPPLALVGLGIYNAVLTGRSLIHMFAPDGGAESIATIDTDVAGGGNIIGMFGQWGLMQLMVSMIVWVVLWRYRGLVPLMALVVFVEPLMRIGVGELKPIETVGTAPGAVFNYILLPLLACLLVVTLRIRRTPARPR